MLDLRGRREQSAASGTGSEPGLPRALALVRDGGAADSLHHGARAGPASRRQARDARREARRAVRGAGGAGHELDHVALPPELALRSLRPVAAPSHGRRRPGVAPRLPPRGSAAAHGSAAAARCFSARCFSAHGSSVRKAVRSIRAAHDARSSQSSHARSQALHARCRRARSQALHAYAVRPCGAAHDASAHDATA